MGRYVFKLPDIGEGIAEAEIAAWRVEVGQTIKEDQPLVDMLTEKAAVELGSPVAGRVVVRNGNAGDKIAIGSALVEIELTDGAAPERPKADAAPAAAAPSRGAGAPAPAAPPRAAPPPPAASQPPAEGGEKPAASPAVRRRAREQGLDLASIPGSGRGGRITHEDLEAFVARGPTAAPRAPAAVPAAERDDTVEEIRIIGLRRRIAEAMQRSKQRIPHFAYVEEVDVTELESLREHMNGERRPDQAKLTVLPFLLRAIIKALPEFPQVNARFDDEAGVLRRHRAAHVGVATQTPNGLVVPVVRHAQALDIWGAAAEIRRLAEAARAGKATREELSGSTITISSLGPMGGIVSTPVINAPEVAIVGVNKIVERPVVWRGQIAVRQCMNLSSSFDHRIVDGWDAASFIQRVKTMLEHPATLFMS